MAELKRCSQCRGEKPSALFNRIQANGIKLRSECKKCHSERGRAKRTKDPAAWARMLAHNRAFYHANLEAQRRRGAAYYHSHREATRLKLEAWRKANPERAAASRRRHMSARRARERGVYTEKVDLEAILKRDGWKCHICNRKVNRKTLTFDHLIPILYGGPHIAGNLAVAHLSCNSRRGAGRLPAQLLLLAS